MNCINFKEACSPKIFFHICLEEDSAVAAVCLEEWAALVVYSAVVAAEGGAGPAAMIRFIH